MDWKEFPSTNPWYIAWAPLNPWKNPGFFTINTLVHRSHSPNLGPLTSGKDVPSLWNQAWERFCREGVARMPMPWASQGPYTCFLMLHHLGSQGGPRPPISPNFSIGFWGYRGG